MKLFFKLISLVAAISAIASCGSSEKAEDILKLGGISSTGNKEDEESAILLRHSQVYKLHHVLTSFF